MNIKKYISTERVTFLVDISKNIEVNKIGKSYYQKMFKINLDRIKIFINNIEDNKIYLINPFISVKCSIDTPYLNLSRQFLLTNKSHPELIFNFLNEQIDIWLNDFDIEEINGGHYFLVFKFKYVELEQRYW